MLKTVSFLFLCAGIIGVTTEFVHSAHIMPTGWVAFCFTWSMFLGLMHGGMKQIAAQNGRK